MFNVKFASSTEAYYLSEETVDDLCTPEEFFQNTAEFV